MNPQDILNNVTGLLQNAQQASAQAQTHQQEVSQALTAAVQELTKAVCQVVGELQRLTASMESFKPLLVSEEKRDFPILTLSRPRTGS